METIPLRTSPGRQDASRRRHYISDVSNNDPLIVNFCSGKSLETSATIGLLVNHHLTIVYNDIARHLQTKGFNVVWISPSRRWSRWLQRHGWSVDRILTLTDSAETTVDQPIEVVRAELAGLERGGELRIADILLMDRVLRRRHADDGYRFLASAQRVIREFLVEHKVDLCLGEATWAWEIVASMVCRQLGLRCLAFTTVRVPSDRFALFESVAHQIVAHREVTASDREWASNFLQDYRSRPRTPGYSRHPISALSFRKHWLREFCVGLLCGSLAAGDTTVPPLGARMRYRAVRAFNAAMLRAFPPFQRCADLPCDERYVLFCLHHQPEASIDVVAAAYSNQMATIERLTRSLPATHRLWIKEHGSAIGDRSRAWLRQVARLPGVRLIDPRESSFSLMTRADLVISPAGTVCLEAALLGVPAVTLADLFFAPLMVTGDEAAISRVAPHLRTAIALSSCRAGSRSAAPADPIEYLAWIHAQSFPGEPDRMAGEAMAGRLDKDNLAAVAGALGQFLQHLAVQKSERPLHEA